MKKQYALPENINSWLSALAYEKLKTSDENSETGLSIKSLNRVAGSILELSDLYTMNEGSNTPWERPQTHEAYLFYYFPLNLVRWLKVIEQGQNFNFFKNVQHVYDFGAGLGSASIALESTYLKNASYTMIEDSVWPARILENEKAPFLKSAQWHQDMITDAIPKNSLAVFSYSLIEQTKLPEWAMQFDKIAIVEPSTQTGSRKLLELRANMIKKGYFVMAPCLHQEACPLLTQSKTDWCHDRIEFEAPAWFEELEKALPIKNKTLTYSYLLLEKKSEHSNPHEGLIEGGTVRVVGDPLKEKGKTRQMICRNSNREFLSMLERDSKGQEWTIDRGDLLKLPATTEQKSSEIRIRGF